MCLYVMFALSLQKKKYIYILEKLHFRQHSNYKKSVACLLRGITVKQTLKVQNYLT